METVRSNRSAHIPGDLGKLRSMKVREVTGVFPSREAATAALANYVPLSPRPASDRRKLRLNQGACTLGPRRRLRR